MERLLITGANGFIGRALCGRLAPDNKVTGIYHKTPPCGSANLVWEPTDLTDVSAVTAICKKHSPEIVIHCAGIAHQKVGSVDSSTYMRVNSESTENLARAASKVNPDVRLIFLSSVSVYGDGSQINIHRLRRFHRVKNVQQVEEINVVGEESECKPSSDYARSKLDAERRLIALADEGILNDLIILRLAPVYDRDWSFNLDCRVLAPLNIAYIRFGSGLQRMSALARPNLVDFIEFLIHRLHRFSQIDIDKYPQITQINADEKYPSPIPLPQGEGARGRVVRQNNPCNQRNLRINIFNVCDTEAYEFNTLIQVLKNSGIYPNRPVIPVPLPVVWLATRMAGCLLPDKKRWLHSCYDKLASSLIFDNERMLKTGFRPRHSLQTIFQSTDFAD
ncbi:MAG TPA: SDR family oxidoreductase [Proteobacteria bacterium]|nr:SDR family oxidoreductase [Pseudomonadota bacterium]